MSKFLKEKFNLYHEIISKSEFLTIILIKIVFEKAVFNKLTIK